MLSVWIMLVAVLLVSAALAVLSKRKIEECIPILLLGTITALYVFYCLNLLLIGRIALYAAFAVLIVLAVIKLFKAHQNFDFTEDPKKINSNGSAYFTESVLHRKTEASKIIRTQILTPALVLFIGLCIAFLIFSAALKPSVWDELRLWAAMPKAIHFTESLQVGEGSLLFSTMQSYPPGIALLIGFFSSLTGAYSYGGAFALYRIFAAALVLPALKKVRWKQWYILAPAFFAILVFPYLLTMNGGGPSGDWYYYYVTLYIEPILGVLMGAAFFWAVKDPFRSGFSLIQFSLLLFVLPTMKNVGALYAVMAFLVAVVLHLIGSGKKANGIGKSAVGRFLFLLIPILAAGVSYFSWQLIINTRGTGEFIAFKLNEFTGEKFGNVLTGMATWGKIPFLYCILFFIAVDILLTLLLKDISKRSALISAIGFALTFLIFLYGYTSHYALMLSSIHRYTSVFTFACLIYLLMRAASGLDLKAKIKLKSLHTISIVFIQLLFLVSALIVMFHSKELQLENKTYDDANRMISAAEEMIDPAPDSKETAKCYLALGGEIRKQSQRHETYALEAIGTGINIQNIWCDNLYNEAVDGVITDPEEMTEIWAERLKEGEYGYVLIDMADENIIYAVGRIAPLISPVAEGGLAVLKIVPSENTFGITFQD